MTSYHQHTAMKRCFACQTPNADAQYSDGEWYHRECVPVGVV